MTKVKLTCPECGHVTEREFPTQIDMSKDMALYDDVIQQKVFEYECPNCHTTHRIDAPLTVFNSEKNYVVVSLGRQPLDSQEELYAAVQAMTPSGFDFSQSQMRLVYNLPDLIEKVTIFEAGYDDEVVEMVKFLSDGLVVQEQPDVQIKGRFFTILEDEPKLLYITEQGQYTADYHEKLVEFIHDKYGRFTRQYDLGEYQVINGNWAYNLIEHGKGNPDED